MPMSSPNSAASTPPASTPTRKGWPNPPRWEKSGPLVMMADVYAPTRKNPPTPMLNSPVFPLDVQAQGGDRVDAAVYKEEQPVADDPAPFHQAFPPTKPWGRKSKSSTISTKETAGL